MLAGAPSRRIGRSPAPPGHRRTTRTARFSESDWPAGGAESAERGSAGTQRPEFLLGPFVALAHPSGWYNHTGAIWVPVEHTIERIGRSGAPLGDSHVTDRATVNEVPRVH